MPIRRPRTATGRSRRSRRAPARAEMSLGADLDVGGQLDPAGAAILDVDHLVAAIRPEQAEQHREPAQAADLSLLHDRARKYDLPALDAVVGALALADSVDEHRVGRLGAARQ